MADRSTLPTLPEVDPFLIECAAILKCEPTEEAILSAVRKIRPFKGILHSHEHLRRLPRH